MPPVGIVSGRSSARLWLRSSLVFGRYTPLLRRLGPIWARLDELRRGHRVVQDLALRAPHPGQATCRVAGQRRRPKAALGRWTWAPRSPCACERLGGLSDPFSWQRPSEEVGRLHTPRHKYLNKCKFCFPTERRLSAQSSFYIAPLLADTRLGHPGSCQMDVRASLVLAHIGCLCSGTKAVE